MIWPSSLDIKQDLISVTVMGGGFGESVVVNVGGKLILVVDGCLLRSGEFKRNETLHVLESSMEGSLEPKLGFILLTHPHLDHFEGLADVIRKYRHEAIRVCLFQGTTELELAEIFRNQDALPALSAARYRFYEKYREVLQLYEKLDRHQQLRIGDSTEICRLPLYSGEGGRSPIPFSVSCFAPSSSDCQRFLRQARLRNFVTLALSRNRSLLQECNRVSVILQICFGDTKVLLGGDAENDSWDQVAEKYNDDRLASNVLKVSHHGSVNGCGEDVIRSISKKRALGQDTVAIIAPANRFHLPKPETLSLLGKYFSDVLVTAGNKGRRGNADDVKRRFPSAKDVRPIESFTKGRVTVVFDSKGRRIFGNLPGWVIDSSGPESLVSKINQAH